MFHLEEEKANNHVIDCLHYTRINKNTRAAIERFLRKSHPSKKEPNRRAKLPSEIIGSGINGYNLLPRVCSAFKMAAGRGEDPGTQR